MTITINGSGSITGLSAGGLPDATVQQADLAANVAGNGPAFSAYRTTSQSVTNSVAATVLFDATEFNLGSAFTIATGKFQPTVAGYYQLNASIQVIGTITGARVDINKSGAAYKNGNNLAVSANQNLNASCVMYLNGSTDYAILSATVTGTTPAINGTAAGNQTWFDGHLVRAA